MTVNGSAFQRCWLIFLPQRDKKEQTDSVLILQEQQKQKKNFRFQVKVIGDMGVIIMKGTLEVCTKTEQCM